MGSSIRDRLQESLAAAMRARDQLAVSALRSALSAIANAEAVEPAPNRIRLGAGAGDVPRRELADADVAAVMNREIHERRQAAAEYDRLGQPEMAARLRSEARVLGEFLE